MLVTIHTRTLRKYIDSRAHTWAQVRAWPRCACVSSSGSYPRVLRVLELRGCIITKLERHKAEGNRQSASADSPNSVCCGRADDHRCFQRNASTAPPVLNPSACPVCLSVCAWFIFSLCPPLVRRRAYLIINEKREENGTSALRNIQGSVPFLRAPLEPGSDLNVRVSRQERRNV